jgi:hypothetical protein
MTDHLDRIFVEVCFDPTEHDPDALLEQIQVAVKGLGKRTTVTANRPPRIFSDEELEDRFLNLYKTAEKYRVGLEGKLGVRLVTDPRLIYLTTISAFDDIERYKAYHLEKPYRDRSDAVKRSAFLTKWIVKIGPYQTVFNDGDDPRDIKPALANILFALAVSTVNICIDCKKDFKLSELTAHELCYDLLYRSVNEDALLSIFQKFVHIINDCKIIETRA